LYTRRQHKVAIAILGKFRSCYLYLQDTSPQNPLMEKKNLKKDIPKTKKPPKKTSTQEHRE